ncbi:hypothetical protein [Paenibacillus ginsengarvi]|uniref:Uncharacterized protein n=1 Tax=Paenibacillus ginsengarvi TaxID=400777 RepID=A0A3B0CJI4_9BACL|nr:hypothetical protein [Paenibacillus ginsengarvi]RKN85001.1 hypothetical protein D7M11_10790 [Paenibacillus ginsengarvi]
MTYEFVFDERLGIELPRLHEDWAALTEAERAALLHDWEQIRGRIPDRIMQLERTIIQKQNQLNTEDDFPRSCRLNTEIAEIASCITDLHLWFRADQDVSVKGHY